MKPYAVSVTIGDKVTGKEFDNVTEFKAFLEKAVELKKKAPNLKVTIIRTPEQQKKKAQSKKQKVEVIKDQSKEDSLCWKPIYKDGKPVVDYSNRQLYRCIPVPQKPKVFYCPYCNAYKQWAKVDYGYGLIVRGCPDCEVSDQDFYIKTANNLWKGMKA